MLQRLFLLLLKSNSLDRRLGVELLSGAVALQGVEQTLGVAMEHSVDGVLAGDVLYLAAAEVVGRGERGGIGGG